jgi:hypothetical protein
MACLRAVDPSVLATANANINNAGFYGTFSTVPVVDGAFITQRPTLSLLEGKVNGVFSFQAFSPQDSRLIVSGSRKPFWP